MRVSTTSVRTIAQNALRRACTDRLAALAKAALSTDSSVGSSRAPAWQILAKSTFNVRQEASNIELEQHDRDISLTKRHVVSQHQPWCGQPQVVMSHRATAIPYPYCRDPNGRRAANSRSWQVRLSRQALPYQFRHAEREHPRTDFHNGRTVQKSRKGCSSTGSTCSMSILCCVRSRPCSRFRMVREAFSTLLRLIVMQVISGE